MSPESSLWAQTPVFVTAEENGERRKPRQRVMPLRASSVGSLRVCFSHQDVFHWQCGRDGCDHWSSADSESR